MLCWTKAGAVPWPTTVQIRLAKRYEHRIRAGAPSPSRQLTLQEFQENARYFRHTLDTSRSKPCHAITLSALQEETPSRLENIAQVIRTFQYDYVRVHIDLQAQHLLPYLTFADHIALSIQHPKEWSEYNLHMIDPARLYISILMNHETLLHIHNLRAAIPEGITITLLYPFPLSPKLIQTAPPLHTIQEQIARLPPSIQVAGLPPCLSLREGKKTSNRWYVDADHQKDSALLFFPDLLRYYKSESCRFCVENASCDGFFVDYLNEHVQLNPIEDSL